MSAATMIARSDQIYAFYDLHSCPLTFDYLQFLAGCEAYRQEHNAKGVHVSLVYGPRESLRMSTHKDRALDQAERVFRLRNILLPCTRLLKNLSGVSVFPNVVDAARLLSAVPQDRIFPEAFEIANPTHFVFTSAVVRQHKMGRTVTGLQAPAHALRKIDTWLDENSIRAPFLTMTLRKSMLEPMKNSNVDAWLQFADYARSKGWTPVAIPDTEVVLDGDLDILSSGAVCCPMAGLDVELRAALYLRSQLNMSFGGGPAFINAYMPGTNYLCFLGTSAIPKDVGTLKNLNEWMGFAWGEQFPWATETQHLCWEPDTLDNLVREFDNLLPKLLPQKE